MPGEDQRAAPRDSARLSGRLAESRAVGRPPPSYRSPAAHRRGEVLPRHGAGQGYAEL